MVSQATDAAHRPRGPSTLDIRESPAFSGDMTRKILPALIALLICGASPKAQGETLAVLREDGLLVLLPGIAGPRSYGTYLVPSALGRESFNRFVYLGNPLQINFLPPSELPADFARMSEKEKLRTFFRVEARYLSRQSGETVAFTDERASRVGGVEYLSGRIELPGSNGSRLDLRLKARTAGDGILHAGYFAVRSSTIGKARLMTDRMLRSFRLVRRPLTQAELQAISSNAQQ
jgi:hypothetical protein